MLKNCSECGGQVSDTATVCPHCGAPAKEVMSPEEVLRRYVEVGRDACSKAFAEGV